MVSLVTTQAHARKFWGWETNKDQIVKAHVGGKICYERTYYVFGIGIKTELDCNYQCCE
jgi:hypothetical protein